MGNFPLTWTVLPHSSRLNSTITTYPISKFRWAHPIVIFGSLLPVRLSHRPTTAVWAHLPSWPHMDAGGDLANKLLAEVLGFWGMLSHPSWNEIYVGMGAALISASLLPVMNSCAIWGSIVTLQEMQTETKGWAMKINMIEEGRKEKVTHCFAESMQATSYLQISS